MRRLPSNFIVLQYNPLAGQFFMTIPKKLVLRQGFKKGSIIRVGVRGDEIVLKRV